MAAIAGAAATQAFTACSYSSSPASQVAPISAPSNGERTGNAWLVLAGREPTMMAVDMNGIPYNRGRYDIAYSLQRTACRRFTPACQGRAPRNRSLEAPAGIQEETGGRGLAVKP